MTDYEALIGEGRRSAENLARTTRYTLASERMGRLADAVEALLADNTRLDRELHFERTGDCESCRGTGVIDSAEHRCGWCGGLGYIKSPLVSERDALRAQLDDLRLRVMHEMNEEQSEQQRYANVAAIVTGIGDER